MEVERIKDHLWIRLDLQPQSIGQTMGTLCYEPWRPNFFLETLAIIKFPHGLVGSFQSNFIKKKWGCMKSHDFHVLMQQNLHVCLCHKMFNQPWIAIMWICPIFQWICAKVWDPTNIQSLQNDEFITYSLNDIVAFVFIIVGSCTAHSSFWCTIIVLIQYCPIGW